MNPRLLGTMAVSLSLALLVACARAADRPDGSDDFVAKPAAHTSATDTIVANSDSAETRAAVATPALSPFLQEFLAQHQVTVVTEPVRWVSAIGPHDGLLTRDDTGERLPALLWIESGSSGDFAKRSALELAQIGYVVLIVEIDPEHEDQRGTGENQNQDENKSSHEARRERVIAQTSAAVRWLRRRDDVFPDRIGTLCSSAAARWALETAAAGGLQAAVLIDPQLPIAVDADLTTPLRHTAVLVVRGAAGTSLLDDEYLARLERQWEEAGVQHRVLPFDRAKTGFLNAHDQNAHDRELADRAWFEIYEFLGKHVEDVPLKKLLADQDNATDGAPLRQFASIADLMRAANAPAGVRGSLALSLTEEPTSENEWKDARARAALLADAGELLMGLKPPKGDSALWQRHVASYRDAAQAIAAASDRRDYSAARQALERLTTTCGKCHLDHR